MPDLEDSQRILPSGAPGHRPISYWKLFVEAQLITSNRLFRAEASS